MVKQATHNRLSGSSILSQGTIYNTAGMQVLDQSHKLGRLGSIPSPASILKSTE